MWLVLWVVLGTVVGMANGFSYSQNLKYVNFSIVHVSMFIVILLFAGIVFYVLYRCWTPRKIKRRFGMSIYWTIMWFIFFLLAFFGIYPFFPIYQSLTPDPSVGWPEERFQTNMCNIR